MLFQTDQKDIFFNTSICTVERLKRAETRFVRVARYAKAYSIVETVPKYYA